MRQYEKVWQKISYEKELNIEYENMTVTVIVKQQIRMQNKHNTKNRERVLEVKKVQESVLEVEKVC